MISYTSQPLYDTVPSFEPPPQTFGSQYRARLGNLSNKQDVPDFLIISPPKTGTTWLATHLAKHPQIFIPPEKEVRYFDLLWKYHDLNWYAGKFKGTANRIKGDASPQFAWLPEAAIAEVQKLNPRIKLLFLARRLPDRAWSHTRHCFRYRESNFQSCTGSFEQVPQSEIVKDFLSDLSMTASDYPGTLRRWMRYFPVSQFHVQYFEDALATPNSYLTSVFQFLSISPEIALPADELRKAINSGLAISLPEWAEPILADIYARPQAETEAFLAETFNQRSPWRSLTPVGIAPIWLFDWHREWRIFFYSGRFHAVRIEDTLSQEGELRDLLGGIQTNVEVCRGAFAGELLCELEQFQSPPDACLISLLLAIQDDSYVHLIDSYRGFNLVRYRGFVYGIRQSLGPLNVRDENLRQNYSSEDIILGETTGEVQVRIDVIEAQRAIQVVASRLNELQFGPAGDPNVVQLIDSYRGFNLVRYGGKAYGIRQSLGPIDIPKEENLQKRYSPRDLIIGDSLGEIRVRIDVIFLLEATPRT